MVLLTSRILHGFSGWGLVVSVIPLALYVILALAFPLSRPSCRGCHPRYTGGGGYSWDLFGVSSLAVPTFVYSILQNSQYHQYYSSRMSSVVVVWLGGSAEVLLRGIGSVSYLTARPSI